MVVFMGFMMDASGTKSLFFFFCDQSQSQILVRPQRVSGDNPVFLDPLTRRHLVVLARSWSCQRGNYGRSVFNLQKWTLPESRGGTKRRVEMKPGLFVWMQSGSRTLQDTAENDKTQPGHFFEEV